ncbi:hypothetical protein BGX29_006965 [Mortierella sp. GBA35]|nr:hypothetical protein BGX29_006965 [Mortierella sp. GBA35]KAG0207091.1 hypothetical protein BGX33_007026 [Mortierella sp. NVP41]
MIGGPQYDRLYDRLATFEQETGIHVEIVYKGSHPELNDYIASTFPPASNTNNSSNFNTPDLDLISTHVKYAPSQAHYLQELDHSCISQEQQDEFLDSALEACKIQGKLMQLPRMVDSRVLFYRADILEQLGLDPPKSWQDLQKCASIIAKASLPVTTVGGADGGSKSESGTTTKATMQGYVFPGKLSGLFGTFYELAMMEMPHPEALFDKEDRPVFEESTVVPVLSYMRQLVSSGAVPTDVDDYYFDQVSTMFTEGRVAMVADWPSYYRNMKQGLKRAQLPLGAKVKVMRYPVGENGSRSVYSGMHSFAIPKSCRHPREALQLLKFLVRDDQQWLEATESGSFPTKKAVLQRLVNETEEARRHHQHHHHHKGDASSVGELDDGDASSHNAVLDSERLQCLRATVEEDMAMFPHLLTYPDLEDALYPMIQDAMMGRLSPEEAAHRMKARAMQPF